MKEVSIKRQITEWIFENYNITFLPKHVYIYLGKIYHGNFKNMSKPIPAIDLLDMWKRKMDYLNRINRINAKNIEKARTLKM